MGNQSPSRLHQHPSPHVDRTDNFVDVAGPAVDALACAEALVKAINEEEYETALQRSRTANDRPAVRNLEGVCLLRLGRYQEAVELYRELVLYPSTLVVREDLPLTYKTNFATALLLCGQVTVCLRMLSQIGRDDDPTVQQLQAAIARWERALGYWTRLQWHWGAVDPTDGPVPIDFVPGQI